jgi:hypothetical protein
MANTLGNYNPIFYANEALIQLEKALGMANVVHRGYEPSAQQKGSTISIKRPSSFTAQSMPISSAANITTEVVDITLDQWYGVVFALTDKELSHTKEVIIEDHIRPAAVANADKIDDTLCAQYIYVGEYFDAADPGAITDFTGVRNIMFDNKVPLRPRSMMIDGEREADYLALDTFHEANKSADGDMAQREGFLGRKFGFDIFANQNVKTHVQGTVAAGDTAGSVTGAHAVGVATLAIGDLTDSQTVKAGDSFTIAGDSTVYAVTADATSSSSAISASISPTLQVATSGSEVVTFRATTTKLQENLAFHRNAFALAMAPLSDLGNQAGARIGIATDPITNIALRSRLWYEGKESAVYVGIDALWGVKTLDARLAVRMNS